MALLPPELQERVEDIRGLIEVSGAELVEVEYHRQGGRRVLVFLVDKAGGIPLNECAKLNQAIVAYFDALEQDVRYKDFFQHPYTIEVNSPGLDRPLRSPKDFARAVGQKIEVRYRDASGREQTIHGMLIRASDIEIELHGDHGQGWKVVLQDLVKAVRVIEFNL